MAVTWNPSDKHANVTLSNGNLTMKVLSPISFDRYGVRANISYTSGKWYWEVTLVNDGGPNGGYWTHGVMDSLHSLGSDQVGSNALSYGHLAEKLSPDGGKETNGLTANYGSVSVGGDIISHALDMDAGKIWWAINGVWQEGGDPGAGTNEAFSGLSGTKFPACVAFSFGGVKGFTVNFGASSFAYSVPSGFLSADDTCPYTSSDLTSRTRILLKDTLGVLWTDTQISNELEIAAEDISSRSFCVETVSDILTSDGVVDYAAPAGTIEINSCVYDDKGLQRIHPRLVAHLPIDITGPPEYWYYYNGRIGIYPVPDSAYTINVYHSVVTEDLNDIPCFLRPLLVWHTVSKLRGSEGWVDDELLFRKMYDNSLDFARDKFFAYPIDSREMMTNG